MIKILLSILASAAVVVGQASPPVTTDSGVTARPFDISQVVIDGGRLQQNQVSHI